MKQATGSNPQIVLKKVSIQLALDGHSFSASEPIRGEGDLLIEVLSPRTMLVPEELFDQTQAADMLAANGMPLAPGESVVWSDAQDGIIAVTTVCDEVLRSIAEDPNIRPHYTTPLLYNVQHDAPTVWMYRAARLLYIKVYDRSLCFAEVIPAPTDADVLYFTDALGREFPFGKYELRLAGGEAKSLRKLLNGWFKRTISVSER